MAATKPILYSYFRSSASWRVRVALAIKGIEYEYKPVHLVKDGGQQHSEDYKTLNPMEQVPTLIIDGATLNQSIAIMEYLEETRPGTSLLPKDPIKRAQARCIAEMLNSGTQPLQNLNVLQYVGDEKKVEWANHWITRGLAAVEKRLEDTAGTYCVGDEVTVADICLVPQIYNALRFKVDMSKFPTINRVCDECDKLDAFKAGKPSAQPDCPEEPKK